MWGKNYYSLKKLESNRGLGTLCTVLAYFFNEKKYKSESLEGGIWS